MDLVEARAAGVIFDNAKVILRIVRFGMSGDILEFLCASLVLLLLADHAMSIDGMELSSRDRSFRCAVIGRTRIDARHLEGVLDGRALVARVATLGNFCVVQEFVQKGTFG